MNRCFGEGPLQANFGNSGDIAAWDWENQFYFNADGSVNDDFGNTWNYVPGMTMSALASISVAPWPDSPDSMVAILPSRMPRSFSISPSGVTSLPLRMTVSNSAITQPFQTPSKVQEV